MYPRSQSSAKNNPIFVGEAGVGKTAIVEGLARAIDTDVLDPLESSNCLPSRRGRLDAGTRYRGDFENRMKAVVRQLEELPDAVLFVDEIHTLIGAGAASGGAMDAPASPKPLSTRENSLCCATTWREYRNIFERDTALARRFQKIEVGEPSIDETESILRIERAVRSLSRCPIRFRMLREAAVLAGRYPNDRFLPDSHRYHR